MFTFVYLLDVSWLSFLMSFSHHPSGARPSRGVTGADCVQEQRYWAGSEVFGQEWSGPADEVHLQRLWEAIGQQQCHPAAVAWKGLTGFENIRDCFKKNEVSTLFFIVSLRPTPWGVWDPSSGCSLQESVCDSKNDMDTFFTHLCKNLIWRKPHTTTADRLSHSETEGRVALLYDI